MIKTTYVVLVMYCAALYASDSAKYERQVVENPSDYRALYNAGVAAFKENKFERAQECFNLLKTYDYSQAPLSDYAVPIFYNAGNTEVKLQQYEQALKSFEKVLEYDADHERARKKCEYLKKLLEQQKQQQEQERQQQKEQQKKPDTGEDKQKENKENQQGDGGQKEHSESGQEQQDSTDKEPNSQSNKTEKKDNKSQQEKTNQTLEQKSEQSEERAGGIKKQTHQLTEEEQRILAAVQDLDERMHEALEKKKIHQARGVQNARNNW